MKTMTLIVFMAISLLVSGCTRNLGVSGMTFACSSADDTSCGAGCYCQEQPGSNQYWGICVCGVQDIPRTDPVTTPDISEPLDPGSTDLDVIVTPDLMPDETELPVAEVFDTVDVTLADVPEDSELIDILMDAADLDIQTDLAKDWLGDETMSDNADPGEIEEDL